MNIKNVAEYIRRNWLGWLGNGFLIFLAVLTLVLFIMIVTSDQEKQEQEKREFVQSCYDLGGSVSIQKSSWGIAMSCEDLPEGNVIEEKEK